MVIGVRYGVCDVVQGWSVAFEYSPWDSEC